MLYPSCFLHSGIPDRSRRLFRSVLSRIRGRLCRLPIVLWRILLQPFAECDVTVRTELLLRNSQTTRSCSLMTDCENERSEDVGFSVEIQAGLPRILHLYAT